MTPHLRFDFEGSRGPERHLFEAPLDTIEARQLIEVPAAMAAADEALAAGLWVAGFVAYEAAPAFDAALRTKAPGALPLVWFGIFDKPVPAAPLQPPVEVPASPDWTPDTAAAGYAQIVARIRAAIREGEVYQVNHTLRLRGRGSTDDLDALYAALVGRRPPPFAARLDIGRWRILSLSPELFFERRGDTILTRPMKGTIRRGRDTGEDRARSDALRRSEKDRAENVMIVDLMRNDLTRIAEIGSVEAVSLFDIERYPSVFQMTSTIGARLCAGTGLADVFRALFPAGSITGAPKAASMRVIAALEDAPRGVYCGAIGFAGPGERAVFNVAIRTATFDASTGDLELGVGGGITWDSRPDGEYDEALAKAGFFDATPPFSLIETMRLETGAIARRDLHLARLARSADYFDFVFDRSRVDAALDAHVAAAGNACLRVRLLLAADGKPTVESEPLRPSGDDPVPVRLATTPVSSLDPFFFHKTTRRETYEQHRSTCGDAFDVLLWNERRELTEFTIGNVVVEIDGRRLTPPVTCGLLAGVFRQSLLAAGVITEGIVSIDDLARVTRLWLINSVREWVSVELMG